MKNETVIVIPARLASTRLPEKALVSICGKPMIQHVYERAKTVRGVHRVIVATDHEKIEKAVKSFGGEVIMTSPDFQSGTDRVAAVASMVKGDIFVNLQGDEPLMDPATVERALVLVKEGRFSLSTAACPFQNVEDLNNPNVVKVLLDQEDRAIYFSRHPIPYSRVPLPQSNKDVIPLNHQGIYVFEKNTLEKFSKLPRTNLETSESLEQLRALYYGIPIGVARVSTSSIGVDTPEDLEKVRKQLVLETGKA